MKMNPEERREALRALGIPSIGRIALSAKEQKELAAQQRRYAREQQRARLHAEVEAACSVLLAPPTPKPPTFTKTDGQWTVYGHVSVMHIGEIEVLKRDGTMETVVVEQLQPAPRLGYVIGLIAPRR